MADTGSVAVEKKKRKRTKKNKKASAQQTVIIVDDDNTDSDEDEDEIFNYLNMSPTSAQAQSQNSSSRLATQELNAYEGNHMEDPVSHTIGLVTQLSNGSYSLDRVTNCVHRMWDSGLPYDSVEAVLKELSKEDEGSEQGTNLKIAPQEQEEEEQEEDQEEEQDPRHQQQVDSTPPPTAVEQKRHVAREDSPATTTSSSSSPTRPISPTTTTTTSTSTSTPVSDTSPEYSLSARLELAASHPDLSEALVALETWCRLVGPVTASKEFFECQALEILLQKLISDPSLMVKVEVKDALIALFLHVFPSPSSSSSSPESSGAMDASVFVSSLENFLQEMSQLHFLQISSTEKCCPLANRVSESLRAVHSNCLKEQDKMQNKGSEYALESDIFSRKKQMNQLHQKLLSGTGTGISTGKDKDGAGAGADIVKVECSGSNIRDILELSDVTQELLNLQLEKHANHVSAAGKKSSTAKQSPASVIIADSPSANKKLEMHILAASGSSRMEIDNLKAQAASISTYYDRLSSENDSILAPYRRDFIKCNETLSNLQQNYQYMQLQLKNIENEMNMVKNQATSIQTDMSKIKLQQDARMNDLTTSHTDVVQAIEKDKEMQSVLENVKILENMFDKNTNAIWGISTTSAGAGAGSGAGRGEQKGVDETADLESFFDNYVLAEMKCTEFLCKRHSLMIEKTAHLEREIVEYTNLGMKNLAADILKSIDVLKENRLEDVTALVGVQESLYTNMQHVKSAKNPRGTHVKVISQQAMQYLHQIATSLRSTGIALHPDIADYLHYQATPSTQTQTQSKTQSQKQPQQQQEKKKKQQQQQTNTTGSGSGSAPLPPRQNQNQKKDTPSPSSSSPSSSSSTSSSAKRREVTPPPGLRLPTPPSTPPTASTSASTCTSAAPAAPAAPSWGGWGTIPKVSEPFTISK